jgi:hypothetical protein
MHPTQNRHKWWGLLNMIMSLWVIKSVGNFRTS